MFFAAPHLFGNQGIMEHAMKSVPYQTVSTHDERELSSTTPTYFLTKTMIVFKHPTGASYRIPCIVCPTLEIPRTP